MIPEKPKEKTKVGKFLQSNFAKIVGSVLIRPAGKILTLGMGVPIIELASNLLGEKKKDPVTGEEVAKHSWMSITVQLGLVAAVLLDIVLNKGANLLALVDLIGLLPADAPVQ